MQVELGEGVGNTDDTIPTFGHVIQNQPCWDASYTVGLAKQSNSKQSISKSQKVSVLTERLPVTRRDSNMFSSHVTDLSTPE